MVASSGKWSLHANDIRQFPASIEVGFGRRVEAEVGEPAAAGDRRDHPVFLLALGGLRPEVQVHGAIVVLDQSFPGIRRCRVSCR